MNKELILFQFFFSHQNEEIDPELLIKNINITYTPIELQYYLIRLYKKNLILKTPQEHYFLNPLYHQQNMECLFNLLNHTWIREVILETQTGTKR